MQPPSARDYAADVVLRDGSSIHLRSLRPDDREALREHFEGLSPQSVYFRFFSVKRRLTEDELAQFTELDFDRRAALVATLRDDRDEHIIGVGRWIPRRRRGPAARRGRLRGRRRASGPRHRHAAPRAPGGARPRARHHRVRGRRPRREQPHARGVRAERLPGDALARAGRLPRQLPDGRDTCSPRAPRAAASARRRRASIEAILRPRSVAVVGASRQPGTIGATLVENLVSAGFTGSIYLVNPEAAEIAGRRAYPSVGAIGAPVDLAVIAVPAARRRGRRRRLRSRRRARRRRRSRPASPRCRRPGVQAERRLRDLVRGSGMRMVGPNCMGVLNTDPAVSLNATFAPTWPPAGQRRDALAERRARPRDPRPRAARSTSASRASCRSATRPTCRATTSSPTGPTIRAPRVIVLYLESFGNPRTFARLAPEVARRKPIVAVKSGRSAAGTARRVEPLGGAREPRRRRRRALRAGGRHPHRHARGAVRRRRAALDAAGAGGRARRRRHERRRPGHPARRRVRGARASSCRALGAGDASTALRALPARRRRRSRTRST